MVDSLTILTDYLTCGLSRWHFEFIYNLSENICISHVNMKLRWTVPLRENWGTTLGETVERLNQQFMTISKILAMPDVYKWSRTCPPGPRSVYRYPKNIVSISSRGHIRYWRFCFVFKSIYINMSRSCSHSKSLIPQYFYILNCIHQ